MISIHGRRQFMFRAVQALDLVIFCAAIFYAFHFENIAERTAVFNSTWRLFGWLITSLIIWHFALAGAHLYRSHRLDIGFPAFEIVKGVSMGAVGVGALALLFQLDSISLDVIVRMWWMSGISIIVARTLLWVLLISLRNRGRNLRFILVVGSGQLATRLIDRICEASTGYRVIGYVDDLAQSQLGKPGGIEYLGTTAMLPRILAEQVVDAVFIALPMRSFYDTMEQTIRHCEEQGIPVHIPWDLFVPGTFTQYVHVIEGMPILSLTPAAAPFYVIIKRIIDVFFSVLLLILLAPLFIGIALLIKFDSPGPVFFVQKRVGMHKWLFPMFKFRTMYVNSEAMQSRLDNLNEASGPVFKIRDDPRVTHFGRFLRRTSFDELPQLFNVLVGHMSLVGPRPLPVRDVKGFRLNWQRRRFSVQPGITCLWQINGRSLISFDHWMELDMLYIDRRCLLLDLKIMLQTIPAVLKKAGAY